MNKFVKRQITKSDSRRKRNMNRPITSREIELVIFKSSHKPDGFTGFNKYFVEYSKKEHQSFTQG